MTTKHTPGPWEHGRNHIGTGTVSIRDHAGDAIAYATCERHGYGEKPNDDEAMANANLIAAAPDLLSALEIAEGVVDWACDNGADARNIHKTISAAIAKAKGGES